MTDCGRVRQIWNFFLADFATVHPGPPQSGGLHHNPPHRWLSKRVQSFGIQSGRSLTLPREALRLQGSGASAKGGSTHFQLGGWGPGQEGRKNSNVNVAYNHSPPQANNFKNSNFCWQKGTFLGELDFSGGLDVPLEGRSWCLGVETPSKSAPGQRPWRGATGRSHSYQNLFFQIPG